MLPSLTWMRRACWRGMSHAQGVLRWFKTFMLLRDSSSFALSLRVTQQEHGVSRRGKEGWVSRVAARSSFSPRCCETVPLGMPCSSLLNSTDRIWPIAFRAFKHPLVNNWLALLCSSAHVERSASFFSLLGCFMELWLFFTSLINSKILLGLFSAGLLQIPY